MTDPNSPDRPYLQHPPSTLSLPIGSWALFKLVLVYYYFFLLYCYTGYVCGVWSSIFPDSLGECHSFVITVGVVLKARLWLQLLSLIWLCLFYLITDIVHWCWWHGPGCCVVVRNPGLPSSEQSALAAPSTRCVRLQPVLHLQYVTRVKGLRDRSLLATKCKVLLYLKNDFKFKCYCQWGIQCSINCQRILLARICKMNL